MKKLLFLLLLVSSFSYGQTKLTLTDGIRIRNGQLIDSISKDTALGGLDNVIPTQKAIRDYFLNRRFKSYILTVAQFRASTGIPIDQLVETIDYGGGTWKYVALFDGQYVDDTATTIVTTDNHVWQRVYSG